MTAKIYDNNRTLIGVVGLDSNMKSFNLSNSIDFELSNLFYYYIIDKDSNILWHSKKALLLGIYNYTQFEYTDPWPP